MARMKRVLASTSLLLACGSPAKPATSTAAAPETSDARATEETNKDAGAPTSAPSPSGVPMSCASQDGNVCLPDPAFVKRVCNGSYPDVALLLFSKDAPFTRVYLKGDLDGWNAEG